MKKALTILLLLLQLSLFAGNPGDDVMFVTGTVVDKQTSETLAGVEVRVKGTNIVTFTDFDGNFFINDLPSGSYELQFSYVTYSATKVVTGDCNNCPAVSVVLGQR